MPLRPKRKSSVTINHDLAVRTCELLKDRRRKVEETPPYEWKNAVEKGLGAAAKNLKDASLWVEHTGYRDEPGQRCPEMTVYLSSEERRIAHMKFWVRERDKKVEAVIEEFQGHEDKESVERFREKNNVYWNIFLVDSLVTAAWDAGLSQVLLRDITTTKDYDEPFGVVGVGVNKARQRMEHLYMVTKDQCGFTKRDGCYWLFEFTNRI